MPFGRMGYCPKAMIRLLRYWFRHSLRTGFRSFHVAAINWADLMWFPENQKKYTLFREDNALEECLLFFWDSLEDNTLPIEIYEYIEKTVQGINDGTVNAVSFDFGTLESTNTEQ